MNQKSLLITALLIVLVGASYFLFSHPKVEAPVTEPSPVVEELAEFVTDVDPDVSHWQTKETEFFTIKFPKEWYWLESDLEKTGYHSQVITNNFKFAIGRFSDISVFTGTSYRFIKSVEQSTSIPLKKTEIVVSTNGFGWATTNAGTPYDFLEAKFASVRGMSLHNTDCKYTSSTKESPLTAYCIFEEDTQRVETRYISYPENTYALTSRTTIDTVVPKDILEKIVGTIQIKY